jgi:hypothetical protein
MLLIVCLLRWWFATELSALCLFFAGAMPPRSRMDRAAQQETSKGL